jgi:hypothetical protein
VGKTMSFLPPIFLGMDPTSRMIPSHHGSFSTNAEKFKENWSYPHDKLRKPPQLVMFYDDLPMKNGDVPVRYVFYNERVSNELLGTHCHG